MNAFLRSAWLASAVLAMLPHTTHAAPTPPPVTPSVCAPAPGSARLRIGVADDRPPLSWTGTFRLRGIVTDYLALLPRDAIDLRPMPTPMLRQRLQQGELDAAIGVSTRAVPTGWKVSAPLLEAPDVAVSRRQGRLLLGLDDLRGRVVAVLDPLPPPLERIAPQAHEVGSPSAALRLLERGNVELVVGNALLLEAARRRWRKDPLVVASVLDTRDAAVFAVAPNCEAWLEAFARRQAALGEGQRRAIVDRWRTPAKAPDWRDTAPGLWAGAVVFAIAGLYLHGYRRLRGEVRRRLQLQKRVDEVTANLPAVVFQAEWPGLSARCAPSRARAGGPFAFLFLAGDTPQLFSATPATLRGDPARVWAAIDPARRWRVLRALVSASRSGRALQLRLQAQGARGLRHVTMQAWPADPSRPGGSWSGYWIDVTDAEARAQETAQAHALAQRDMLARERLLHRLGEGMRGPLQALIDKVLQIPAAALEGPQREAREALEEATTVLARILEDILAAAPTTADALSLRPAPVDLRELLQSVQHAMAPLAAAKALPLTLQCDPALAPWVQADSTRLRQILFNLLGNAIKFTARGGVQLHAQVIASDVGAQLIELAVSDTGVGIAPERLQSVFAAFEQADVSISRRFGGTGLGLGISRRLAEAMGGTLELRSVPARGTTALVRLMLPCGAAPADAPAAPPAIEPPRVSAQVLVADDHPTHRLLLQWRLRELGLVAEMAVDGAQAFQLWSRTHHRLVITDAQMPVLGGAELLRLIHAEQASRLPQARTVVVGMSADPAALGASGFDAVLGKPLQRVSLAATIQRLCPDLMPDQVRASNAVARESANEETHLQRLSRQFGSEMAAREVLGSLRASLEQDVCSLEQALDAGDGTALARGMHRIAGGVGSVGMTALAQRVRDLGERAHDPAEAARQVLPALQAYLQQLRMLDVG